MFIIWFGIGEGLKYATIAFGTFFPTVVNTYGGVDDASRTLIRMGQSFGLSKRAILRSYRRCQARCQQFVSAFRISATVGIILLVAAEMISAEFGIGAYVLQQQNLFQLDRLMAGVLVLMALGSVYLRRDRDSRTSPAALALTFARLRGAKKLTKSSLNEPRDNSDVPYSESRVRSSNHIGGTIGMGARLVLRTFVSNNIESTQSMKKLITSASLITLCWRQLRQQWRKPPLRATDNAECQAKRDLAVIRLLPQA